MIGSLMYLTTSMPDIMFVVCVCVLDFKCDQSSLIFRLSKEFLDILRDNLGWAFGILKILHLSLLPTQIVIMEVQLWTENPLQEVVNLCVQGWYHGSARSKLQCLHPQLKLSMLLHLVVVLKYYGFRIRC